MSLQSVGRDKLDHAIEYVVHGEHAFVGIDRERERVEFVNRLLRAVSDQPNSLVAGLRSTTGKPFANSIVGACSELLESAGIRTAVDSITVAGHLESTMRLFQAHAKQGYLVVDNIDPMISSQHSMEIEGALRSVMQRFTDVAVVLCGSTETVSRLRMHDRPFYCSFRSFVL